MNDRLAIAVSWVVSVQKTYRFLPQRAYGFLPLRASANTKQYSIPLLLTSRAETEKLSIRQPIRSIYPIPTLHDRPNLTFSIFRIILIQRHPHTFPPLASGFIHHIFPRLPNCRNCGRGWSIV